MNRSTCILAAMFCLSIIQTASAEPAVWFADPLEKIFPDSLPGANFSPLYEAAAGEHATFQVVVRSSEKIDNLTVECSDFVNDSSCRIKPTSVRFAGFVPVDKPTHRLPKKPLRKIPSLFPDPLMEYNSAAVGADTSQPVWITVKVPTDTDAGIYHADIILSVKIKDYEKIFTRKAELKVFNVSIDKSRLQVTNWFGVQDKQNAPGLELAQHENESDGYYRLLRKYAADMAAHRQNVALIPVLNLTNFSVDDTGTLKTDFSRFDKWVRIFKEEGVIGKIEGAHLGYAPEGFNTPFKYIIKTVKNGSIVDKFADPQDPDCQKFYSVFMPSLVEHLKEQGWLDIYIQHIADEPTRKNKNTYIPIAKIIRECAPQLKITEACYTEDLVGYIDIWCPKLPNFDKYYDFYSKRAEMGQDVWFYTSVSSQNEYANRFIEMRLIKTRLLHWINFKYGATGFLHWGYNHWTHMGNTQSPFTRTVVDHPPPYKYLPAGDAWIIYPGKDGPLDSIRFEAMRDGIADYELLKMLEEKAPEAAKKLAGRLVKDFDKYNLDIKVFRQTRRELLMLLEKFYGK